MILYERQEGVPQFRCEAYQEKKTKYCVLIPVINEGERILRELKRAVHYRVSYAADIILCDGGSTDGSTCADVLRNLGVNSLLVKQDSGKQGAQLRMGIWWALRRGYEGIITIDGNNKDSIEDIPRFIECLEDGYDFVQGSRFLKGGHAINTPPLRLLSVRLLHAPIISLTAGRWFTDTTNAYRAYSRKYLEHDQVQPLRDIFITYELLAYLSVRAVQLGMKVCEIPVTRRYPKEGKTPTKISFVRGNWELMKILFLNLFGQYNP
ncbi:glycosyltransferase family 2 protein [Eisenbergiella tayi]|uniref:glycosyltransferase family 2 protein n=1 Tax=Eisenbergiella tayi TaxID=1432052 RepID=UPI000B07EB50|nr:glycosyltransferase family 2 protein [Eisenbergiella tayi]